MSLGQEKDTKTRAHRTVRLLAPLREDLLAWRLRSGRPGETRSSSPATTAAVVKDDLRQLAPAGVQSRARGGGVERATPYALRHRFASLLLHEGR